MKSIYSWAISWPSLLWTKLSLASRALCGTIYLLSFKFGRIAGVFPGVGEASGGGARSVPRAGGWRQDGAWTRARPPACTGERDPQPTPTQDSSQALCWAPPAGPGPAPWSGPSALAQVGYRDSPRAWGLGRILQQMARGHPGAGLEEAARLPCPAQASAFSERNAVFPQPSPSTHRARVPRRRSSGPSVSRLR